MKLEVIESSKSRLLLNAKGLDATLGNVLVKQLWQDSDVKVAAIDLDHPLVGTPKLIVETSSNKTPKKALSDAIKKLMKTNDKFREEVKSAL